jgi:hypothetical protein
LAASTQAALAGQLEQSPVALQVPVWEFELQQSIKLTNPTSNSSAGSVWYTLPQLQQLVYVLVTLTQQQ